MPPDDRQLRRALTALEDYRLRQSTGIGEPATEFLAAHADLRSLLEPLLATARPPEPVTAAPATVLLPRAGQRFGPYQLLQQLGQGASSTVFLAEDTRLGRKVALKILHPELLTSQRGRERFWREARAASSLDHPNVCPIYDVGVVDHLPFLAMRYVAGETLAARIARNREAGLRWVAVAGVTPARRDTPPPGTGEATPPFADGMPDARVALAALLLRFEALAAALAYVHQRGLVHRDIKPANLMLDADDQFVLLDFGLAREHDAVGTGTVSMPDAGTPRYLAPEQVTGRGAVGPAADVYALAVTLYESVALRHPFEGATHRELLEAIATRTPPALRRFNRRLPADLQVVLDKAMDKDPGRRYATAALFAEDLRRVRLFLPLLARPAPPPVRLLRWMRRNRLASAVLATLSAATAVAALLLAQIVANSDRLELQATAALLQLAEEQARGLEPAFPDRIPALQLWLQRFDGDESLRQRRELVEHELARLRALARPRSPAELAADRELQERQRELAQLERQLDRPPDLGSLMEVLSKFLSGLMREAAMMSDTLGHVRDAHRRDMERRVRTLERECAQLRSVHFDDPRLAAQHAQYAQLLDALDAADRGAGVVARMRANLVAAEAIRAAHEQSAADWHQVREELQRDARFPGLDFDPQDGLVPLGRDPRTRLQEFWHARSGTRPQRDPSGRLQFEDTSGLVFVLLPGGRFTMTPNDPEFAHEVELAPFLLSKYEMTQHQWQQLGGENTSMFRAGSVFAGHRMTARHPIENVSQLAARALLERHGLLLPTEAQWEYACQAAKGQQPRRCNYFGNAEHVPRSVPVDAFEPGIWGLYNQHGNVAEMCRDVACQHFQMVSHAPGDGLLLWFWGAERAARGGSFYQDSDHAGAAFRTWRICHIGFPIDGVRPARAIQGRP